MKQCLSLLFFLLCLVPALSAQNVYKTEKDISYVSSGETDTYRKERCKLDVYYPANAKENCPVVVWFHGGGLTGGSKDLPRELQEQGIAVVSVNYRLSPQAKCPAYLEDAAEAIAWTYRNIAPYGGNKNQLYVAGHSAGGYLALMVGLDKSYLNKHGLDADQVITALFPLSGQTVTHYTIRAERNLADGIPVIDRYAPSNRARKDTPPVFLITGDRRLEMTARYEENALLEAVLKGVGNNRVTLYELQGFDHGTMCGPGCRLLVEYIHCQKR